MTVRRVEHISVGGVPTALVSEEEIVSLMVEDCASYRSGNLGLPLTIFDTNGQALSMRANDAAYAKSLDTADLVHADGQFIVWMSKLGRGAEVPERSATTDLFLSAAEGAARTGIRFYLLGGSREINEACATTLEGAYPGLTIAGRRDGYFSDEEEPDVIADINASDADVVWVGLGKPKEQLFSQRNKPRLKCAWIVTCGGCFHYVVGDYPRAPVWMQKAGLEWMHRMATGPRYLVGRYLYTIPHAVGLVIYKDLLQPLFRSRGRS